MPPTVLVTVLKLTDMAPLPNTAVSALPGTVFGFQFVLVSKSAGLERAGAVQVIDAAAAGPLMNAASASALSAVPESAACATRPAGVPLEMRLFI